MHHVAGVIVAAVASVDLLHVCLCSSWQVCELREARLEEEEAAADVGRSMEQLKKDRESLAKKERLMDQVLKVHLPPLPPFPCPS